MGKKEAYFSDLGKVVNNLKYPDYEKTRFLNWGERKNNERRLPELFNRKEECRGCFACYSTCSKKAIIMKEDLEGFVYPTVDLSKCVCCYKCEKICPIKQKKVNDKK